MNLLEKIKFKHSCYCKEEQSQKMIEFRVINEEIGENQSLETKKEKAESLVEQIYDFNSMVKHIERGNCPKTKNVKTKCKLCDSS